MGSLSSFRALVYLEWLLLVVTAAIEIVLYVLNPYQSASWQIVLISLAFGAIGWGLRSYHLNTSLAPKVIATLIEAGLILATGNLRGPQGIHFISVLCIIATIRACLRFRQAGRAIVTGSSIAIFIALLRLRLPPPIADQADAQAAPAFLAIQVYTVLYFVLILVVILLLVSTLLAERQSRQELAVANQQLRSYALQIENQATIQERSRIAREIHDSLGHTLAAQSIALENTKVFFDSAPAQSREFLQEAIQLGGRGLQDVRQSITALRQNPVQQKGLNGAIQDLLDNFQLSTEIQLDIDLPEIPPPPIAQAIYRIVQEGLTNIQKHSGAQQGRITINTQANNVVLLITDNGRGCDMRSPIIGFGWQGMRERTKELGGTIEIRSQLQQGCAIEAIFPRKAQIQPPPPEPSHGRQ
jgi:signal transduction histidine kinase